MLDTHLNAPWFDNKTTLILNQIVLIDNSFYSGLVRRQGPTSKLILREMEELRKQEEAKNV